jgi:hypothetical protein
MQRWANYHIRLLSLQESDRFPKCDKLHLCNHIADEFESNPRASSGSTFPKYTAPLYIHPLFQRFTAAAAMPNVLRKMAVV